MEMIREALIKRITELAAQGMGDKVFGWKKGDFAYDPQPAAFSVNELTELTYDSFCGANLCKYMVNESKSGKTIVLIKPCDSRGLELLKKEHRIKSENVYAIGIPCDGKADIDKIRQIAPGGISALRESGDDIIVTTQKGETAIPKKNVLLEKCMHCVSKEHNGCDEIFMPELSKETDIGDRFGGVRELEAKAPGERFAFWQEKLSACIRCNACRNVCPACTCIKCVFDNPDSGVASKVSTESFEDKLYHSIRSFHVSGRCVDCGECSRVCPEKIPLRLLNLKYIKDIEALYGSDGEAALLTYSKSDPEPYEVFTGGEGSV